LGTYPLRTLQLLAQQASLVSLKEAAAMKGIHYGSVCDIRFVAAPPAYTALFQQQCALCASDIWAPTFNPGPGVFNFQNSEGANIDFASADGLPLTGAHLLWYYHLPPWFEGLTGRQAATQAMVDYVHTVAAHYKGKTYSWNVVNEALEPRDGQPFGMRRCWPLKMIGPEYFDLAFRTARVADPDALLIYNDSGFELDTAEQERRRSSLLTLIDELQRQKTPVDGVGLQSHLKLTEFGHFHEKRYRGFLGEIAVRGLKILITELDVLDIGAPSDIAQRDKAVAEVYRRFLTTALDEPAVKAVVTWGLCDRYTWLNPQSDPSFARPDGLPTRPLPFDDDLRPTPVYYAMMEAFNGASRR
jgi:endo-1,4-beta-xylanase